MRHFDPKRDYLDVSDWWESQNWPVIPEEALPKTGFIVEDGKLKIAAVWLYMDVIGMLEWLVGNPKAPMKVKAKGIDLLVGVAMETAKLKGSKMVFASLKANNRGLQRIYIRNGFQLGDSGMTNLVARTN